MKFTPSVVIDAPQYYVDHFNGKYDTDKCVVLRDMQLETDSDLMSISLKHLPSAVNILDLTNNELTEFPDLRNNPEIHTLLLARNQIGQLDGEHLPQNICNLVVCNNNLTSLEQLNGLKNCPKALKSLQLRGNQVCHVEDYREYVLRLVPGLQILDFSRVTDQERKNASKIILKDAETNSSNELLGAKSRDKNMEIMHMVVNRMSEERRNELNEQLMKATSLEEIAHIEKLLSGGV